MMGSPFILAHFLDMGVKEWRNFVINNTDFKNLYIWNQFDTQAYCALLIQLFFNFFYRIGILVGIAEVYFDRGIRALIANDRLEYLSWIKFNVCICRCY